MKRSILWHCALLAGGLCLGQAQAEDGQVHAHTNKLVDSASPYLLQHAHNPVNWYPWGPEALGKAVSEGKPILLSIGYAACHWCHVMEHESFENEEIARILNENFISIKVDREERPDIDEIYMTATTTMTGRGGWPMTVFMTPDGKPFECGTYFPPEDRGRRRGFRGLCLEIADKWRADRAELLANAGTLAGKVRARKTQRVAAALPARTQVSATVQRIASSFDDKLGGRRSNRNKFPPTLAMELMLREYATQPKPRRQLLDLVEVTLDEMARGGIYDHLEGGICRYSTDPRWFAPDFEKMLYDQASASGVYLSAYQLTHKSAYAETARSILDYCLADLQDPAGGFYSSRDADSEGEEGKYYVWTWNQLEALLVTADLELFSEYYGVTRRGNWHGGQNILHRQVAPAPFAKAHGLSESAWRARLDTMHRTLLSAREGRVPPGLDDKVLSEWNGLLITSLARGYRILNEPRYRLAATRAADFVLEHMIIDGRLFRAHRRGTTHIPGYATDYTNMIEALITLYETTFERRWLDAAAELNKTLVELFHDPDQGGFLHTADDAEKLLARSKNTRDGVVPSGSSVAALNLMRLAIHLNRPDLRELAEATMQSMGQLLKRGQLERMHWTLLYYYHPPKEIAIVGAPDDPATQTLVDTVYSRYQPNKLVGLTTPEAAKDKNALPLLRFKKLLKGKPAGYVCQNYQCKAPVSDPGEFAKLIFGTKE